MRNSVKKNFLLRSIKKERENLIERVRRAENLVFENRNRWRTKKKKKGRGNRAVGRGSLEFYALFIFIYALTVVRVCGIYMRAQACILHVRITRNDRPGWLPLTVRAPAFLRLPSNGLPNYTGQCGQGGGVPRAYVSFTDFSAFIERTRASPPIQIVPRRDVDSTESRLKTG